LGLTVARHIVQQHGGVLHVESQPGHGTICHVQLPLTAAPPGGTLSEAPVHEVSGPEAQERVLNNILNHASELPRQIAYYISKNYAVPLSREDIARAMQVSQDYVSRTFRKETGMTPWEFLNRYRVLQAQKLLLESSHNVTEIAAQVGFNDPGYFVRVFHRETGKSPQQYRKSAK
jgi:AraC-like DNA-binding protein